MRALYDAVGCSRKQFVGIAGGNRYVTGQPKQLQQAMDILTYWLEESALCT